MNMDIPSKEEWMVIYNTALEKKIIFSSPTPDEIALIAKELIEAAEIGRTSMTLEPPQHRRERYQFQPMIWLETIMKLLKEQGYSCEIIAYSESVGFEKIRVDFFPL